MQVIVSTPEELGRVVDEAVARAYRKVLTEADRMTTTPRAFQERLDCVYRDLLRYGVFLRDVRGKSLRGAVVPRLYLRRLLIPTFNLTPNQRDSVSMEDTDFLLLLYKPEAFVTLMEARIATSATNPDQQELFSSAPSDLPPSSPPA